MFPTDLDVGHHAPSLSDSWAPQRAPRSLLEDGWVQGMLVRTACCLLSSDSITVASGTSEDGKFWLR